MVVSILLLISCGGGKKSFKTEEIPSWYLNPPKTNESLFAAATATSTDLQLAMNKAKQEARLDLATQLEAQVSGLIKKFDEDVGKSEESEVLSLYSQVSKTVVDQSLSGTRVKESKILKEGKVYRVYVLMELPTDFMKEILLNKIKAQQALYTRFRASKAFEELEKEVKELRDEKMKEDMQYMNYKKSE